MKKEKQKREFWKKIRFKYKLSAINENTLEEVWSIRTSIFSGAILVSGIALLLIALTSVIIITTPIRYYLPGYMEVEIREKATRTAIQIDSLEQTVRLQEAYLNNIRQILMGSVSIDSVSKLDSVYVAEDDPVLAKSEREKEFVSKYEEEEKYTLGMFSPNRKTENILFYKPLTGVLIQRFDDSKKVYQTAIQTAKTENVLSVLEGTVIFAGYDVINKYSVHIQHKNSYVSMYRGLTQVVKKVGDEVKTSEVIGVIAMDKKENGGKIEETGGVLTFELWNKGVPVNPELYITF